VMLALLCLTTAVATVQEVNFSTYRVTPITYPGVTNMDSGDAAGDVMFGLEQLLLPQLCLTDPSFLWCENRKYLSGGAAHMVYSEFVIATRDAFGDYQACNPCAGQAPTHPSHGGGGHSFDVFCPPGVKNGTFVCQTEDGGGAPPPEQCQAGFDVWHRDCLNGTVYKTLSNLDPKTAEGDCCAACSADKASCAGWNMPKGDKGTTCQLMKEPLVMWQDGQYDSTCKAAEVDHRSSNCWYDDSYYNSTFADFCDRSKCYCEVLEKNMPIGRELHPMCHQDASVATSIKAFKQEQQQQQQQQPTFIAAMQSGGVGGESYWSCSDALEEVCFNGYMPSRDCSACATDSKNAPMLKKAGCTPAFVKHLCEADFPECEHKLESVCASSLGHNQECTACVQKNTAVLEQADCTSTFVEYVCQGGGGHSSKWESYIDKLSCIMNGAWYSTAETGRCKGNKLTPDCWWYVAEAKRTVNQTCVDGNVITAVQSKRPDCWTECPDNQGTNITSACFLTCLFETLLGNSTTGIKPMTRDEIMDPFVKSFESKDHANGGCADVHVPTLE